MYNRVRKFPINTMCIVNASRTIIASASRLLSHARKEKKSSLYAKVAPRAYTIIYKSPAGANLHLIRKSHRHHDGRACGRARESTSIYIAGNFPYQRRRRRVRSTLAISRSIYLYRRRVPHIYVCTCVYKYVYLPSPPLDTRPFWEFCYYDSFFVGKVLVYSFNLICLF